MATQQTASTGQSSPPPPKELTEYQLPIVTAEWYRANGTGRAYIDTFQKARRIGGSTAAAFRGALLALGRELRPDGSAVVRDPMNVWVVSKDFSSSKGLLKEVAECCDELAPFDNAFRVDAKQTFITFPETGKTISALPCSGAACRGKTGAVVADEVAFWRQMQEVWAAAKIIADPNLTEPRGYPILAITTPWEEGSLAHQIFTDAKFPFRRHSVDIYQAVAAGFPIDPQEAFAELGIPELIATEYLCQWARGGASFFPIAKLRDCQVDDDVLFDAQGRPLTVIRSGLPEGWHLAPCRFGIDIGGGRGRDFTAIVQWRFIDGVWWMVGLKAFNNLPIDVQVDIAGDWILGIPGHVQVTIRADQGVMGLDFIRLLSKKLGDRRRTSIIGMPMMPTDQERYAISGRRLLERSQLKLYTGTEAGGDENGARALMLELSQLKAKPGTGGHLTFATPRDPTKGHLDRAWASLVGLDEADDIPLPIKPPSRIVHPRWGNRARGFG